MPSRTAKKAPKGGHGVGAQEGILQGAAALINPALQRPEELITRPAPIIKALRGTCSSLYSAARISHKGGLGRIYTGEGYDADQIYPQLEEFTDSVTGGFDDVLAGLEKAAAAEAAVAPPKAAKMVEEMDDDEEDMDMDMDMLDEEDEEALEDDSDFGEAEEGDEDEGEEALEMDGDEEGEEDEELEEASEESSAPDALAAKRGTTKIGAARKQIDRQDEDALLQEIEGTYKKKKAKKTEDGGKDEEEDLLDKLEGMYGESDTDDSFEPAIGTTAATRKEPAKAARKGAKEAKAAGKKEKKKEEGEKEEEGEKKAFDPYAGYGSDDEEDEEEDEVDEDMMKEMAEDEKAMKEMYGIGNFEPGKKFGRDEDDDGFDEEQVEREKEKMKRSKDADFSSDEEEVIVDDEDEMDQEELVPENGLTPFQQRQAKLQKKISQIEDDRMKDTHWTLQGETMASARPENALLEEVLEFDHTQAAKPLITAELTKSLEERLKKRIQENMFDDVVRKERRSTAIDLTIANKNEIDLHAKSKVGLADLYEKEWLDNHRKSLEEAGETTKELTEEEKEELKVIQMWRALSSSLDMLSNFYYTPKPAAADELAVRAATRSAISMEEATPAAVSNAKLLAPQDVAAPSKRKFDDAGADELTTRDKKRLRRTIKENVKAKNQRKEHQKAQKEVKKAAFSKAKKE